MLSKREKIMAAAVSQNRKLPLELVAAGVELRFTNKGEGLESANKKRLDVCVGAVALAISQRSDLSKLSGGRLECVAKNEHLKAAAGALTVAANVRMVKALPGKVISLALKVKSLITEKKIMELLERLSGVTKDFCRLATTLDAYKAFIPENMKPVIGVVEDSARLASHVVDGKKVHDFNDNGVEFGFRSKVEIAFLARTAAAVFGMAAGILVLLAKASVKIDSNKRLGQVKNICIGLMVVSAFVQQALAVELALKIDGAASSAP
jgi:hypothetical protein